MTRMPRVATTLTTLTVLTALAGCGQSGMPLGVNARSMTAQGPVIMAAGELHKLGFNMARYRTVFAPHAHKVHLPRQAMLPTTADLRSEQAPVYDQGQLGSCTAFAIAKGFREFLQRKNGEQLVPLSALWFYYNERAEDGDTGEDAGSTLSEGFSVLSRKGCAVDTTWPYDIAKFTVKPPKAADATAAKNRIENPEQLSNLDDVRQALAGGQDVSFGFTVYDSFRNIGANGMMPVPKSSENVLGGHAVTAVGYDDQKQVLIVRNSWSTKWGDKGYFYMPYKVFNRDADDIWTASK
ncbi:MAG TPA: C1 family peptidase [Oscillatoriaceae cyanobacterium]